MQGKKLLPGQQNIAGGGLRPRTPDRGRGDRALDAGKEVGKTAAGEFRDKFQRVDIYGTAEFVGRFQSGVPGSLLAGLWPNRWARTSISAVLSRIASA